MRANMATMRLGTDFICGAPVSSTVIPLGRADIKRTTSSHAASRSGMIRIMELILSPELQRFVDDKVKSGRFSSAQEVVFAALAVLMQHDALESYSTSELEAMYPGLRAKIAEGLRDLREGRVT